MQVLRRFEGGERQSQIGSALNLSTSTIRTILKNKEKILSSATTTTTTSATRITRSRGNVFEEMERRLSAWIEDEVGRNNTLSQAVIMEKARTIFNYIQDETSNRKENFVASRGWFHRFKNRINLRNMQVTGETSEAKAITEFSETFKGIIEKGNYPSELVFSVDETSLFWKRLPKRTFLSREEKPAGRDRLTLLLGSNASGDFKLKPLLVHHSTMPKSSLPVIWESNKKSLLTMKIFQNWFTEHFCPSVKGYCQLKKLEPKALLLINNAPNHPTHLSGLTTCIPVKVVSLPNNQVMNQSVLHFKANYLQRILRQLTHKTDKDNKESIRDFWNNYTIMDALDNVVLSWNEVTQKCLKGVWKKVWPELNQEDGTESFVDIHEIVNLANAAGLDNIDAQDIRELLQATADDNSSNGDLQELEGNEEQEEPSTDFLKKSIATITEIMDQFVQNDSNFDRSSKVRTSVIEALSCYQQLLDERNNKRRRILDDFDKKKQKLTNQHN